MSCCIVHHKDEFSFSSGWIFVTFYYESSDVAYNKGWVYSNFSTLDSVHGVLWNTTYEWHCKLLFWYSKALLFAFLKPAIRISLLSIKMEFFNVYKLPSFIVKLPDDLNIFTSFWGNHRGYMVVSWNQIWCKSYWNILLGSMSPFEFKLVQL